MGPPFLYGLVYFCHLPIPKIDPSSRNDLKFRRTRLKGIPPAWHTRFQSHKSPPWYLRVVNGPTSLGPNPARTRKYKPEPDI